MLQNQLANNCKPCLRGKNTNGTHQRQHQRAGGRAWAKRVGSALAATVMLLSLGACQSSGKQDGTADKPAAQGQQVKEIRLLTHNSFHVDETALAAFEKETGYKVVVDALGDGGELTSKLVLTKDAPLGDVVFGVDNTFASRLIAEDIVTDAKVEMPAGVDKYLVEGSNAMIPVDMGDVCINVDNAWYQQKGQTPPAGFADLVKPEYKDQLVVMNPASSTPGLAFVLATIGEYGADGWAKYWEQLRDNGVKVTPGWEDAFNVDYSAGEGKGPRPIMVSYSSSPTYFMNEAGTESTNSALLNTCFRQVEYAAVLKGAKNPEGAKAFVEFLLDVPQQESIPELMYMYPVNPQAKLPQTLAEFGPLAEKPLQVDPAEINSKREEWIRTWNDTVIG